MRNEILTVFQQMVKNLTGAEVVIGSLPPLEGYAVSFAGGSAQSIFWTLNSAQELPIQFTGKSADQQHLAAAMDAVHAALTTSKALPSYQNWQMYSIETTSAPTPIGREQNKNWIFGSSFRIKFYAR